MNRFFTIRRFTPEFCQNLLPSRGRQLPYRPNYSLIRQQHRCFQILLHESLAVNYLIKNPVPSGKSSANSIFLTISTNVLHNAQYVSKCRQDMFEIHTLLLCCFFHRGHLTKNLPQRIFTTHNIVLMPPCNDALLFAARPAPRPTRITHVDAHDPTTPDNNPCQTTPNPEGVKMNTAFARRQIFNPFLSKC